MTRGMSSDGRRYYAPTGGHPPQTDLTTDRAVFTEAYAVLPRGTMRDIVTSNLPFWDGTRLWVIARPLSGFAETFSQYIVEVAPGGGSDRPELDPGAEGVLFVVAGGFTLTISGEEHDLSPGGYAFLPPGCEWTASPSASGLTASSTSCSAMSAVAASSRTWCAAQPPRPAPARRPRTISSAARSPTTRTSPGSCCA